MKKDPSVFDVYGDVRGGYGWRKRIGRKQVVSNAESTSPEFFRMRRLDSPP